jgi:glycosyltransferase involved in cell wall biosynthesis
LVSIILPVFNAEPFLVDCINSLVSQTYSNFELLAINDGSSDRSLNLLEKFANKDNRIRVINNKINQGIVNVLNCAVKLCRGELIARMDADDYCEPDRLEKQVVFLNKNKDVGIVGCWLQLFGKRNTVWHYRAYDTYIKALLLFKTNGFPHNAIVVRKQVFEEFSYDPNFKYVEDTELWVRIMMRRPDIKFANIREVLVHYRMSDSQVSHTHKLRQETLYNQILKTVISGIDLVCDYDAQRLHSYLIEPTKITEISLLTEIGNWVIKLTEAYEKKYPDDFRVIQERWFRLCLLFENREKGYECYRALCKKSDSFSFLQEKEFLIAS